jgi:NADH-quinone oxidoreductase subunit H
MDAMLTWLMSPEILAILIGLGKALVIFLVAMLSMAWGTWLERRMLGLWQDRYGPNRVGPFGLGQVLADMFKALFKEDWMPPFADKFTFILAPFLSLSMMLLGFVFIPLTPTWGIANPNVAVLLFLALGGLAVYAVMLAGWSSGNKYSLLGGVRSTAQTISYEVFMGLSLMGVVMMAGSFNLRDIVQYQMDHHYFLLMQFPAFCIWVLSALAVIHRAPFDLPEAESELVQGYHTEYASMKFAMFMLSEYLGMVMVAALTTAMFFGGWHGPFWMEQLPFLWFGLKTFLFICAYILVRAALPRPRYDQLMSLAWKVILPISLINLLVTAAYVLWTTPAVSGN